jgi:dienelactone hydrolase
MKLIFALFILLFLTLNASGDIINPESFILDRTDGSKINYYIIKQPDKSPADVLLVIFQGSDCNSVLNIKSIFSDYRNIWPKADLLLVEKYGIDSSLSYNINTERKDCPTLYLQHDNPKQRVLDIKRVLDQVQQRHAYRAVIVMGGSEGGVIANLFSAKVDYLDATIAFNGGGRWFIDDVLHSISSGYDDSEAARASLEDFKEFAQHILNSEPSDLVVSGHGYEWWRQMLMIDQLDVLQKVNSPLLIVQGGADLSVSPDKVGEMLEALKQSESENIEHIIYDKLDHGFRNRDGGYERQRVVTDIHAWLKIVLPDYIH